jgi:stage IV sporulation protein FB
VLYEPQQTAWDLRWRMFGIHVRVHPFFYLLVWMACVFVSILFHELGHVLMGRLFGSDGHIVLYSFGGLAVGSSNVRYRWQRVLVLLAGPLPPLALAGILYFYRFSIASLFANAEPETARLLKAALAMLIEINFYWSLLNLLPIWPLDGGQATREVCESWFGSRGTRFALGVSLVVAGLFALHFFLGASKEIVLLPHVPTSEKGSYFNFILFLLLAASSFQALQAEHERHRYHGGDDDWPWSR